MHYRVQLDPLLPRYMPRRWWQWLFFFWLPRKHVALLMPGGVLRCHPDSVRMVRTALEKEGYSCDVEPRLGVVQ